jgi:2-desacetyl-2-hydroxyethyl bacteriochlorophyllide A dehydrogenase
MKQVSLYFTAPGKVSLREAELGPPDSDQVLVETALSAISPGTEMLFYRGQFRDDLPLDVAIPTLSSQPSSYPLKYGYAAVGRVRALGSQVDRVWRDRIVFSFHPHESHFHARPDELIPVPEGISPPSALFLPNMETAVNFLMDGRPLIGERASVFGQGIVGLLTAALLADFPLASLVTFDRHRLRRETSLELGASASYDPSEFDFGSGPVQGAMPGGLVDLTFELSGAPAALDQAIAVTGFDGRILLGSWYGKKPVSLDLGGRFHRSRIRLISSQVSTLTPGLMGRWTKNRRLAVAWDMIRKHQPERFITQRMPFREAAEAYDLIDRRPEKTLQVILDYDRERA